MIRHLGGQIKHRSRSKWKSINFHPNIPIINFEMKSGLQALGQINVPRYLYKIHYLLLSSHQFGKGTVDMDFSLLLHNLTQRAPSCCCHSRGSPPWSPWGPRSRASSWTFSPTSIFQRSPPHLAVTFLHFCLKLEITFDTKSSLHENLQYRSDWVDLKLCSYEVTHLHLKYI